MLLTVNWRRFWTTAAAPRIKFTVTEIPAPPRPIVLRRARRSLRLWIILDEYNQDIIGQSFYLEPDSQLGHFSKAFFLPLMKQFIARRQSTRGVNRQR